MKYLVSLLVTTLVVAILAAGGWTPAEQAIHAIVHGVYHVVAEFQGIAAHVAEEAMEVP